MATTLSTAPTSEPITLAEAKLQLRIDGDLTADDDLITAMIEAARIEAETFTDRAFIDQTWTLKLDSFPFSPNWPWHGTHHTNHGQAHNDHDWAIIVPFPPLSSVTSITYIDENGDSQTWSSTLYTVDTDSTPGRVYPIFDGIYPATRSQPLAVTVTFVAGFGATAASVPLGIKMAIRMQVAQMYKNRGDTGDPTGMNDAVIRLLTNEQAPEFV